MVMVREKMVPIFFPTVKSSPQHSTTLCPAYPLAYRVAARTCRQRGYHGDQTGREEQSLPVGGLAVFCRAHALRPLDVLRVGHHQGR